VTTALVRRVLLATDFSDCATLAQEYAVLLAAAFGASLDVVHVLELYPGMDPDYAVTQVYLDQLRKDTDQKLDDLVNRLIQRRLRAKGTQILGIPSQRINAIAKELDTDLVVLGTRGRTGLEHILLGSTAERVVQGAPCPVLTVRLVQKPAQAAAAAGTKAPPVIRRILAPVDFSDCSLDALEYGIQVAARFQATVTILHVMEPVAYGLDFTLRHADEGRRMRERADLRLSGFCVALKSHGLTAEQAVRGGLPSDAILGFAREQGSDLIVMGTHGRRGISHLMSGSVAEAVLRRASCPVLTVKSPKFGPGHRRILPEANVKA
jgi:nucleotide-binding universal stress UspA family protein